VTKRFGIASLFVVQFVAGLGAAMQPSFADIAISPIFSSRLAVNGVTTTDDGRVFAVVQPLVPTDPEVVEIRGGKPFPFPDDRWNAKDGSVPVSQRFVGANALRVGPDGSLWIVDRGSKGIGQPQISGAAKLVRVDLASNTVARSFDLAKVVTPGSFVDDVRFVGSTAYLTDAGDPAIIVLDLASGVGRRVLERHPSTVASKPLRAEGKPLLDPDGKPVVVHVDQIEVSPDQNWLYFQPCSGGMSRIELRYLNDAQLPAKELANNVMLFADTPSTGGTTIDTMGNIYLSDTDQSRILKISPAGDVSPLIEDHRLAWVDAMWIDRSGNLLMPAAQLNRSAGLNHGIDQMQPPISIFIARLDARGTRN
jgi:sugar lactone lactonase YvrE